MNAQRRSRAPHEPLYPPSARGTPRLRRGIEATLASLLFAFVALQPAVARAQIFSPGKLIRAHGSLDGRCTACHDEGKGSVPASKCLDCHKVLRRRIAARKGFHGRRDTTKCTSCHSDHKGRSFDNIKWPGGKQSSFAHPTTGFKLEGKHAPLQCRKCHQPKLQQDGAVRRFPATARRRTFLGLSTSCQACHKDVHAGAAGKVCLDCHSPSGFKPVSRFRRHTSATVRFALRGKHLQVPCAKCHKPRDRFRGVPFGSCKDCHRTPHRDTMSHSAGRPKVACRTCHEPSNWKQIGFAAASHPSATPLRGKHRRVGCARCHGPKASTRPKGSKCVDCHANPHKQVQFGLDCKRCHGFSNWRVGKGAAARGEVSTVQRVSAEALKIPLKKAQAVAFHSKTRFPLTGRHIVVDCDRCHRLGRRRGQKLKRKFTRSFDRCDSCHKDEHQGQFARHETSNVALATRCDSCHPTSGMFLTSFSQEQHDRSRFPLQRPHRAVPCSKCHGRRRPKAERFTYPDRDCSVCHKDSKHRGKFRISATAGERFACAPCHRGPSFREITFDHDKTKLRLQGRHAQTACTSCHRPNSEGNTIFRGTNTRCESCHADRHQGQLTTKDGCGRCHTNQQAFKIARFDHGKLTRFALRGRHRQVKCRSCHHDVKLNDGKRVTLYRPLSKQCRTCHQSRHEDAIRRMRARLAPQVKGKLLSAGKGEIPGAGPTVFDRCDDCHAASGWRNLRRAAPSFDHGVTGYPLRGRHRSAACTDCHRAKQGVNRQCNGCHESRHRRPMGDCAECHEPHSWRTSRVLERHRRTRLPLTGQHALADCSSCHPDARSAVFRGVPAACYGCHADRYNNPSIHPPHHGFSHRCEGCHRPTGWVPASFTSSAAALQHRSFPLTGRHGQQACVACHKTSRPRAACLNCHRKDRARAKSPAHDGVGFSTRCQSCHSDRSWRAVRYAAHRNKFPLLGKHRALGCTDCHDDDTSFRQFNCTACHQRTKMAASHRRTAGFVSSSRACKRCHPLGRK